MSTNETLTLNFIRTRQAPPPGKRKARHARFFTAGRSRIEHSGRMNYATQKTPCWNDLMFKNRYACVAHFSDLYLGSPYYSAGRAWSDYAPAYAFGYDTYTRFQHRKFEDVERALQAEWLEAHGQSRLVWPEARRAVLETWQLLDTESPGQVDRPGRANPG